MIAFVDNVISVPYIYKSVYIEIDGSFQKLYDETEDGCSIDGVIKGTKNCVQIECEEYKKDHKLVFDGFMNIWVKDTVSWGRETFKKWVDRAETNDPVESINRVEQIFELLQTTTPIETALKVYSEGKK